MPENPLGTVPGGGTATFTRTDGMPGNALLPQPAEWFDQYDGDRDWFYVPSPFVFRIDVPVPTDVLADAVTMVLGQYDTFTCRYVRSGAGWRQVFRSAPPPRCARLEPPEPPEGDAWVASALRAMLSGDGNSIDIEAGRLARVAVVRAAPGVHYLLLICHHLALDASSWRLIAADLQAFLTDKRLPPRRPALRDAGETLAALADAPPVTAERDYWLSRGLDEGTLPVGKDGVADSIKDVRVTGRVLGRQATTDLVRTAVRNGLRPGELLTLAGAVGALDVFGNDAISVDDTIRGRDLPGEPQLREVVGWLSTYAPFVLSRATRGDERSLLAYARTHLADPIGRGHAFALLKYMSPGAETRAALGALTKPIITCNYVGTVDSPTPEAGVRLVDFTGFDRLDVDSTPSHPLFLTAEVSGRQLSMQLAYSSLRFDSVTAEGFIDAVHSFLLRSAEL